MNKSKPKQIKKISKVAKKAPKVDKKVLKVVKKAPKVTEKVMKTAGKSSKPIKKLVKKSAGTKPSQPAKKALTAKAKPQTKAKKVEVKAKGKTSGKKSGNKPLGGTSTKISSTQNVKHEIGHLERTVEELRGIKNAKVEEQKHYSCFFGASSFRVVLLAISDIFAGLLVGTAVGVLLDWIFKTVPIFMLIGFVVGFFAGIRNLWLNLKKA